MARKNGNKQQQDYQQYKPGQNKVREKVYYRVPTLMFKWNMGLIGFAAAIFFVYSTNMLTFKNDDFDIMLSTAYMITTGVTILFNFIVSKTEDGDQSG